MLIQFYKNPETRPPIPGSEQGAKIFTETAVSTAANNGGGKPEGGDKLPESSLLAHVNGKSDFKLPIVKNNQTNKSCDNNGNKMSTSGEVAADSTAANEGAIRKMAVLDETAAGTSSREREPEGSADITPPFSESSNSNSTPPYIR